MEELDLQIKMVTSIKTTFPEVVKGMRHILNLWNDSHYITKNKQLSAWLENYLHSRLLVLQRKTAFTHDLANRKIDELVYLNHASHSEVINKVNDPTGTLCSYHDSDLMTRCLYIQREKTVEKLSMIRDRLWDVSEIIRCGVDMEHALFIDSGEFFIRLLQEKAVKLEAKLSLCNANININELVKKVINTEQDVLVWNDHVGKCKGKKGKRGGGKGS
jgi:hypothetical protein